MKKNDHIQLKITDIGIHGEGIGKVGAFPLFVKNALPGDEVEAVITKVKPNYGFAKMLRVISPSPDRVQPRCPHAERCGGCQLQELSYEKQLAFKQNMVRERLIRLGGFTPEAVDAILEPIRGMEEPWRYRNKAQYPVSAGADGKAAAGFYAGRTHHLIEVGDCLLEPEVNARILEAVLDFVNRRGIAPYDEESGTGILRHIVIRHGFAAGEIMLCLVVRKYRRQDWQGLVDSLDHAGLCADDHAEDRNRLQAEDCCITSVGFSVQSEKIYVIMGEEYIPVYGESYITDKIGDVAFRISPQSFYQVNPVQMKVLYDLAGECAGLTGAETVWDLYCGIGTIGLYLAEHVGRVIGIETVPEAVENARENAQINGIGNAQFHAGKAEDVFAELAAGGSPGKQVVIVDPPRKGCDPRLLDAITDLALERIVYVSCDPATLARDLKILSEKDYTPERVVPVDQFCHSVHVECVALMSKAST